MAWKKANFRLTSEAPLILHNGELANPLNPLVLQMKKLSGKRSKTPADLEQLAKLEFMGSLYVGEDGIVLPGEVVESCLNGGARKFKEGQLAKSGMYVSKNSKLIFDGPQTPNEMWEDGRFKFQRLVVVSRARILRTRAIFENWSVIVEVNFEDTITDLQSIKKWFVTAGQVVGLCDWRPRYGRFSAELIQD